ncbi:SGNH/GDSL hydrolase family protein [Microbacterium sp. NPDC096154]|uniref:SGNH/GDSL hydrolase family protein n=1 Tax=Microbacterium sp. NPDC096154 TaxID=3155549 RepID=UPI00333460C6
MRTRRILIAVVATAVLVAGAVAAFALTRSQAAAPGCADIQAYQERYGEVEPLGRGARGVTVLGDSYSAGDTLSDRGQRWTDELVRLEPDLTVTLDAVGGTGYANPGLCGDESFRDRIGRALEVSDGDPLIIQGGINDVFAHPADLEAAVDDVLAHAEAAGEVVLIGPIDAPATDRERDVDALLAREAQRHGFAYISTLEWRLPFGADRLHLTAEGHRAYAERVRDALRQAGVL